MARSKKTEQNAGAAAPEAPAVPNSKRVYELTLGYACNYNCSFCSICQDRRSISKTTVEAMAAIEQARKEGFRTIGFGGGEPTIRRDIVRLTRFASACGFSTIRIQTNGTMLRYRELAAALVGAGANYFKFSIHAHRAEIHDRLTRVRGSFDNAVAGLRQVRSLGARTGVDIVVNKLNYRFLPQYLARFAFGEGVSGLGLIYPIYEGNMGVNARALGVKMTEAIPYMLETVDLARAAELDRHIFFNIPYCLLPPEYHPMVPGARLNLKVNTPVYVEENVFLGSKGSKVMVAACRKCSKRDDCGGLWKDYVRLFGTSEIKRGV